MEPSYKGSKKRPILSSAAKTMADDSLGSSVLDRGSTGWHWHFRLDAQLGDHTAVDGRDGHQFSKGLYIHYKDSPVR